MHYLPPWLPQMVKVIPWTISTYEMLYSIFQRDFKDSQPRYNNKDVWFFSDMYSDKEMIFWHLTTKRDNETGERLPDIRRCERLPWTRPMIDHAKQPEIIAFDYVEGNGDTKTYVWLKDYDFLVLLKKYKNGSRRLLTSYFIEYPNYRRKIKKKYDKRTK